jgi:hypothetical protein
VDTRNQQNARSTQFERKGGEAPESDTIRARYLPTARFATGVEVEYSARDAWKRIRESSVPQIGFLLFFTAFEAQLCIFLMMN